MSSQFDGIRNQKANTTRHTVHSAAKSSSSSTGIVAHVKPHMSATIHHPNRHPKTTTRSGVYRRTV